METDICVYGGTASGILAAIASVKRDKSIIIVEPSRWLGGMIGGGIRPLRDCCYLDDIGGLARMMMEKDEKLGGTRHDHQSEIREVFDELVDQHNIKVVYEHRLRKVIMEDTQIREISLDYAPPVKDGCPTPIPTAKQNLQIKADVFIDASYEGDLMAESGVSYKLGRESKEKYNEPLGGQRNLQIFDIDPYIEQGNPESGLLPMIDSEPYVEGAASPHVNACNFRLQWRDESEGTPIGEPFYYDPDRYLLVRRALQTNPEFISWPHQNYDRNNLISGGIPGRQSEFPEADWPERSRIWREWIDHVKIMHKFTGCSDSLKKGEFPDTNDFPHQLYFRGTRRMVGEYVMTQHDLMHQTSIDDSIGLGYGWYGKVDIYPCRLIATEDGKVASEGEVFARVSQGPYPIPYRSITPEDKECGNLLVPVCISASHVAHASIRMEPTFMIMGESAGIAAAQAVESDKDVQEINIGTYQKHLSEAGQVLEWDGTGYSGDNV